MIKDDCSSPFHLKLVPWVGKTAKLMRLLIRDQFSLHGLDLSIQQLMLLRMLSKQEGMDQKQLAFITDRDKTSLTRLLATLERKKWIYRKKSLSDRRVKEVYITAEGSAILETALPLLFDFFEEMEAGISAEDILKTISVLERIQSNVTKMEEQTKSNEI